MAVPENWPYPEYVATSPYMACNHIEVHSVSEECGIVRADLTRDAENLHGGVHGGLLCALADCAAGLAARATGHDYVTQSEHINFLRGKRADCGTVYARADILKRGRTVVVTRITVYDEQDQTLAEGTIELISC